MEGGVGVEPRRTRLKQGEGENEKKGLVERRWSREWRSHEVPSLGTKPRIFQREGTRSEENTVSGKKRAK